MCRVWKAIIKKDRWVLVLVGGFFLGLTLAYTIPMIDNPIRRPSTIALNYVLRITPVGTHIDDVIGIVENHRDWRIRDINRERGFFHPLPPAPSSSIVGEQSIIVHLQYIFIVVVGVSIFYAFDADGYLTEVYMRRSWL